MRCEIRRRSPIHVCVAVFVAAFDLATFTRAHSHGFRNFRPMVVFQGIRPHIGSAMFRSRLCLHLVAVCGLLAFAASDALALPNLKPGMPGKAAGGKGK